MEEKILIAQYHLGLEAELFMGSELGRYLVGISEQEVEDCKQRLADTDPEDAKTIRRLQNEIKVAKAAISWLSDAITMSREAEHILKES